MADQELQRMQELLAQVNREYEQFGRILPQTQQQLNAAKTGIKNFDMQLNLAGNAITAITGAATDYAKAMYNGERGAKAFNKSIDGMATAVQAASAALALLVPGGVLIKGVIAGLGYLAGEAMKAGKVIGEQADMTFKAYQDLAASGAAAGDGMNGVFEGLQKMGLGVQEAAGYVRLFNENAETMAQFGGTVSRGRKQFENTVEQMKPFRKELQALGLNQEAQNEVAMAYVRIQNRLNMSTRDNTNITGSAAVAFAKEMDQLTKVTGMSRKQQEDVLERAMRHQRFAATVDELVAQDRVKEAKQLQLAVRMAAAAGQDLGDAAMDQASGLMDTVAAQKGYMSTQGELNNFIERIKDGQMKDAEAVAQGFQDMTESMKDTRSTMVGSYLLGVGEEFMLQYSTMTNATKIATNKFVEQFNNAGDEIEEQTGKNGKTQEELLANYTRMIISQQETMLAEQKTVQLAVGNFVTQAADAAESTEKLAKAALRAAENLAKLGPSQTYATEGKTAGKYAGALAGGIAGAKLGMAGGTAIAPGVGTAIGGVLGLAGGMAAGYFGGGKLGEITGGMFAKEPAAGAAPAAGTTAPTAKSAMSQLDLKKLGLIIKEGDVQRTGAEISPKLIELAKNIQSIPGFAYFSAMNDKYHQNDKSSKHPQGLALDFVLSQSIKGDRKAGEQIIQQLKSMGASYVRDEYNFPSPGATAPHIHAEVAMAKGGLVTQPTVAMVGERGPEAVMPLSKMFDNFKEMSNNTQESIEGLGKEFKDAVTQNMSELTRQNNDALAAGFEAMINEIRSLVSVNKSGVEIQERLLRLQS
jgi:hypothetical protein